MALTLQPRTPKTASRPFIAATKNAAPSHIPPRAKVSAAQPRAARQRPEACGCAPARLVGCCGESAGNTTTTESPSSTCCGSAGALPLFRGTTTL